jgi:hypothetical protein
MTIRKELIGTLARQTAINANQIIRENTEGFVRPYVTRSRGLREVLDKLREDGQNYSSFISYVMNPSTKVKADEIREV